MLGRQRKVGFLIVAVLTASAACASPTRTSEPVPTSTVDQTGILLVDPGEPVQAGPLTRKVAAAYEIALLLADSDGEDVGYPWIDDESGEIVLAAATPRGRELLEGAGIGIPYRIRNVPHGAAELRRIQDDVSLLGQRGVAGAELIYMTAPDHRDNRVLIGISEMSRTLLDYLAANYPADAIAVMIDPTRVGGGPA